MSHIWFLREWPFSPAGGACNVDDSVPRVAPAAGESRSRCCVGRLPDAVEQIDLPASMAEALRERVAALSPDARGLAVAVALASSERFTFDECLLLTGHQKRAMLAESLDELVAREVFIEAASTYQRRPTVARRCAARGHLGGRVALGESLARVFERRRDGFREACHLFLAAEYERGLDTFVAFCRESEALTNHSSDAFIHGIQGLPVGWFEWFERALSLAAEHRRPPRDAYAIRSRLSGFIAMVGSVATPHLDALLAQLHRESGLALYESLDPTLDPGERLGRAMGATWQRYNEMSEAERVVDPASALTGLARALIQMIGVLAITCDYEGWKKLPSLRAFAPISPALGVIDQLVQGVGARIGGRIEQCLVIYRPLLERLAQPDRAGLDETHHRHMRLRVSLGVCTLEATMGGVPDPEALKELEADAFYESSAALIG